MSSKFPLTHDSLITNSSILQTPIIKLHPPPPPSTTTASFRCSPKFTHTINLLPIPPPPPPPPTPTNSSRSPVLLAALAPHHASGEDQDDDNEQDASRSGNQFAGGGLLSFSEVITILDSLTGLPYHPVLMCYPALPLFSFSINIKNQQLECAETVCLCKMLFAAYVLALLLGMLFHIFALIVSLCLPTPQGSDFGGLPVLA